MYPKNAASPLQVAIGAVVQISDGAVQTSGCTVRVLPFGGAEGDGGGTTAYSTDGVVLYTPTQAETNYASFLLIAKKAGCIPVAVSVVTTDSVTAGRVNVSHVAGTSQTAGDLAVELAKVPKSDGTSTWNATALASLQAEATDALNAYDPPTKAELDTAQGAVTLANGAHGGAATVLTLQTPIVANTTQIEGADATDALSAATPTVTLANGAHGGAAAALTLGGGAAVNITGNLSGSVGSVTGATGSVAGNVGGNVVGSVGSVTGAVGSVTGAVGSVTGAVGSVTGAVGSVTGNVGGNVTGSVASVTAPVTAGTVSDKTGYALSAAGVQAIWDALTAALTTVGSIGKRIVDYLDAAVSSRSTYAGADTAGTTTLLERIVGTLLAGNHTAQSGDTYALANGANGFAAIAAKTANLPSDPADQSLVIAATDAILARIPAVLVGGRMDSNVSAINNGATDGYNATLKLAAIDLYNSGGSAMSAVSGANGSHGIYASGAGGGAGIAAEGGIDGSGIAATGQGAGDGVRGTAIGTGVPIRGDITGDLVGSVGSLATQAKADVNAEVVDALTVDVVPDTVPADGSRPTIAQGVYMTTQFLMECAVAGTTMTIKKPDGTTALLTITLNDATEPTSRTRAT